MRNTDVKQKNGFKMKVGEFKPIEGSIIPDKEEFNQVKYLKKCLKEARGKLAYAVMNDMSDFIIKSCEDSCQALAEALEDAKFLETRKADFE